MKHDMTPDTTNPAPTRYLRPGTISRRLFNPLVAALTRRGLPLAGSRVLEVPGRRSGRLQRVPVNPLELDGRHYLLAPRGQTQWVRNLRAAGRAQLVRGRLFRGSQVTAVSASELADCDKTPVIRAYLDRWGWEVGAFFEGLDADSDEATIAAAAPGFPVFTLTRRD